MRRKCPVCNNEKSKKIKTIDMCISKELKEKICYPNNFDIVFCDKCGMIFSDLDISKEKVDNYYKINNIYDNISNVKREVYSELNQLYFECIKQYINKNSIILDIGCGNGSFLKVLKEKGYSNLWGLDPSEYSIDQLKLNNINGIKGNLYENTIEALYGKVDLVIFTGVLEHLLDPSLGLSNIRKYLNINGKLLVAVPNAEGYEKNLRALPNYFNHEHINHFTKNTLDNFCLLHGLKRCSSDDKCYSIIGQDSPEIVISAIFEKTDKKCNELVFDYKGISSIKKYFEKIEKKEKEIDKLIKNIEEKNNKIIVWGTGSYSAFMINKYPELLEKIECFVDNNQNKYSIHYFGKTVIAPERLTSYPDSIILIFIMMYGNVVIEQIKRMNINNKYILID